MALPITVPYTFGNATTAIPLSNLDSDYATVYQAVNGIGNGSVALANVTISGVSTPITAAQGGTGSSSAFTTNGVVYASSTSALATGSALTFDGTTATTPRLAFGGTTLPSAGTATIFGRSSDNNLYLQTGSGNTINFLDGSQNTMLTLAPTNLFFQISNATKMTLNSSGNLKTIATISVGNATPSTSGAGITFPATQSASSDANTLDDYEEGTWTATNSVSSGTITFGTNNCFYTKIGRQVTVTGQLTVSSVSSPTGDFQITGLPFTSAQSSTATLNFEALNVTAATTMMSRLDPSSSGFYIFHFSAGSSAGAAADFKANSGFQFSCTYFTT